MRRRCALLAVVCLVVTGLAGCSSDAPSTSTDDAATPDGSFCSLLIAFRTSNDALDTEVNSGDTARAEAAITRLAGQTDLLRRKAPAEIKADVDIVAAYVTSLDALFAKYGYDIDAFVGNEEASAEFLALTSEGVDSSLLQLRTYADNDCAVGGGSTSTTAGTIAPASTTTAVAP